MKIVLSFILIIILSSCATTNIPDSNKEYPKTFEEAEQWFDEQHSKPLEL